MSSSLFLSGTELPSLPIIPLPSADLRLQQPHLLRELTSNSFSLGQTTAAAPQLAARVQCGEGSTCTSAATSVTFQTAAAAAAGLVAM
jgi:hypothetical protein